MRKIFLIFFISFFAFSGLSFAEEQKEEKSTAQSAVLNQSSNNFTEVFKREKPQKIRQNIYEIPTLKNLAFLHWVLSVVDINVDENIDMFLKLSECNLFIKFKSNEFEWDKIRDLTKESIKKNKNDYLTRFEIAIPLNIQSYNREKSYFDLAPDSKIKSARLFEMRARDVDKPICNDKSMSTQKFYKSFLIELSRPFSLNVLPAELEKAEEMISISERAYRDSIKGSSAPVISDEKVYGFRKAYLYLYVKIFSYKGPFTGPIGNQDVPMAQALGVLEGYEIYADKDKKILLYSRNYISKKEVSRNEESVRKEIQLIKDKIADKGMLG